MTEFKKDEIVYTKDGEKYMFDHVVGEYAYVAQFFQVQVVNYSGDDFSEEEEVSEFLTRVPMDKLSRKPWVKVIQKETAAAIKKKNDELGKIAKEIGAAALELRETKQRVVEAEKETKAELQALSRKYSWVREIMSMTGDKPVFTFENKWGIPSRASWVRDVRFYIENGEFVSRAYSDDDETNIKIYGSEGEAQHAINNLFQSRSDKSLRHEIAWLEIHPFLHGSEEAKAAIEKKRKDQIANEIDRAKKSLDQYNEHLKNLEAKLAND